MHPPLLSRPLQNALQSLGAGLMLAALATGSLRAEDQLSTTGLELSSAADVLLVVNAGPHAIKQGLTAEALQKRIEPKFTEAGIRTTNIAAAARLDVRVDCDSSGAFFSLTLNLRRLVRFDAGGRTFRAQAATWTREMSGSFGGQTNVVLAISERFTSEFLEDLKRANPGSTLRGKVIASDPKFQFVIVNLGSEQGVTPDQLLEIQRNGETVALIRVKTVNPDHAIGNVLQAPVPQAVLEGDEVRPAR